MSAVARCTVSGVKMSGDGGREVWAVRRIEEMARVSAMSRSREAVLSFTSGFLTENWFGTVYSRELGASQWVRAVSGTSVMR